MKMTKIMSLVMALILVGALFTMPAKATESNDSNNTSIGYEIDSETKEVISLRDEYTQAFLNDNGNIDVYSFTVPINYHGTNGEFVTIDNSIVPNNNSKENYAFTNASNVLNVYMSDSIHSDYVAKLEYDSYFLSVKPMFATEAYGTILTADNEYLYDTGIGNLFSKETVIYKSHFNTDYAITVTNTGIRQNVILKNKDASDSYTFECNLENLKLIDTIYAVQGDSIVFTNRLNQVIYKICHPHAQDANGNILNTKMHVLSFDEETKTLRFNVSVICDNLNDDTLSYPITISNTYYSNVENRSGMNNPVLDLYTTPSRVAANVVWDTEDYLSIDAKGTRKIYLKFAPIEANVSSSQLCLTLESSTTTRSPSQIFTWGTRSNWDESTLVTTNPSLTTTNASVSATGGDVYSTDVSAIINYLVNNHYEAKGYCIQYSSSSIGGYSTFYSTEYGNQYLAPYLMYTIAD